MSSNRPRTFSQPSTGTGFFRSALEILDDDTLDREWVVRNVLGGMAAGFELRGEPNKFILTRLYSLT